MKEMIKEIVATDKASRLEVEKALERREQLEAELAEQREAFEQKCSEEAKIKIEKAAEQLNSGLEANRQQINSATLEKSDILKEQFEKMHKEWEDRIFGNIIEN